MNRPLIAGLAAALIGLGAPAQAAPNPQPVELTGEVKLDRIIIENGAEKHVLADPEVVVPGDRLVFRTTYNNAGSQPVKDFILTNPVPGGVMLAPEGAEALLVSVDGGKNWGRLSGLALAGEAGASRPATAADVTHLRWVIPQIAPGARGAVTYNAIVR